VPDGQLFQYVAWFCDETLLPDDEDYEWPGVLFIRAPDSRPARAWGDELAKTCSQRLVRSGVEPWLGPVPGKQVVIDCCQRASREVLGW
jgi:hypothetical protein